MGAFQVCTSLSVSQETNEVLLYKQLGFNLPSTPQTLHQKPPTVRESWKILLSSPVSAFQGLFCCLYRRVWIIRFRSLSLNRSHPEICPHFEHIWLHQNFKSLSLCSQYQHDWSPACFVLDASLFMGWWSAGRWPSSFLLSLTSRTFLINQRHLKGVPGFKWICPMQTVVAKNDVQLLLMPFFKYNIKKLNVACMMHFC